MTYKRVLSTVLIVHATKVDASFLFITVEYAIEEKAFYLLGKLTLKANRQRFGPL